MNKGRRSSSSSSGSSFKKDSDGFDDIDAFWNYDDLDQKLIVTEKKKQNHYETTDSESDGTEFNYDDSDDFITEDEDEDDEDGSVHSGSEAKVITASRSPLSEFDIDMNKSNITIDKSILLSPETIHSVKKKINRIEKETTATMDFDNSIDNSTLQESLPYEDTIEDSRNNATFTPASTRKSIEIDSSSLKTPVDSTNTSVNLGNDTVSSIKMMKSTEKSARRVSFGDFPMQELSPINTTEANDDEDEINKYTDDYDEIDDAANDFDDNNDSHTEGNEESEINNSRLSSSTASPLGTSMAISTPGSNEFPRGQRRQLDERYIEDEIETDMEDFDTTNNTTMDKSSSNLNESETFVDDSYLFTINKQNPQYVGPKGLRKKKKINYSSSEDNGEEEEDDDDEQSEDADETSDEGSSHLRRSRRATKGKRFAYWKGERPVYNKGTLVGLIHADPTPAKRQKKYMGDKRRFASLRTFDQQIKSIPETFPKSELPSEYDYIQREDQELLDIWDESVEGTCSMKVVCRGESLRPASALPKTTKRPRGKEKVGYAAHSFNVPEVPGKLSGWISGFVDLPPEAIKDAEGVGKYSQIFFVSKCQDDAVELGIADPSIDTWEDKTAQRLVLKEGDSFYVPPGNIYRLENHSKEVPCMLFWTIIKPIEETIN